MLAQTTPRACPGDVYSGLALGPSHAAQVTGIHGCRGAEAVPRLDGRKIFLKPAEVVSSTRAGKTRKHVIDAEEELALAQVHEQSDEIVASLLKLNMLPFSDVVNADVRERAAGHTARNFFVTGPVLAAIPNSHLERSPFTA